MVTPSHHIGSSLSSISCRLASRSASTTNVSEGQSAEEEEEEGADDGPVTAAPAAAGAGGGTILGRMNDPACPMKANNRSFITVRVCEGKGCGTKVV